MTLFPPPAELNGLGQGGLVPNDSFFASTIDVVTPYGCATTGMLTYTP